MPDKPPVFGRKQPTARQGGSATKRDQSASYARLRASLMDAEPLCRYCRARDGRIVSATVLDHVLALSLGGTDDPANLCPACQSCNSAKAVDEQRFINRGYDPRDVHLDPTLADWFRLARR